MAEGEGRFSIASKKYSFGRGRIFIYKQCKSGMRWQRRADERKQKIEGERERDWESDTGMILFGKRRGNR